LANPGSLREPLGRLRELVEQVATAGTSLATLRAREVVQVEEVLDVLVGLAGLDFDRRAPVSGSGPLDALAQVANMLAEELAAQQENMARARYAAEAATIAKSQFLAQMSHEIRTPLTALLGFADLLSVPTLSDSERLNYAMVIRRNGEHLLTVINDILDLSRIEAGRLTVERIPCAPALILSEVGSLMRMRADERGLAFEVELTSPIPATIASDPTRIRQILLNLLSNAIKFTRRGSVRMNAHVAGTRLLIDVIDTGIGIAEDQLQRLFEPFAQGDLTMSRRFGGSGLGLAICRALAEALGGEITVASEKSVGSTFTLALPIEPGGELVSDLVHAAVAKPSATSTTPKFSGTVLVVEDGLDNQVLLTTLLRGYGLTVAVAADGQLAVVRTLEAWRNATPFDVVFMDVQMPVLDGYKATAMLRREGYRGPIVAVTANAMVGERERCLDAGCNDYINKPIDRAKFVATLRQYLPERVTAPTDALYSTHAADPEMAEILRRFVSTLPARAAELRAEVEANDLTTLKKLVHQLKGAAGGYGFASISAAAADVEDSLRAGRDPATVRAAIDALVALCMRARAHAP